MAQYSWPLGDNYDSKYMDSDKFLRNCRTEIKNKFYNTIQWKCQPGFLPFNYVVNYYPIDGIAESITASGIFTENGISLTPSFRKYNYPDSYISALDSSRNIVNTKEGVRLTKLYYRINDGKWMELSPSLKNISFDLSNNGDKVEIKATYQLWTMGNPHSPIPFLWLGDEDGIYNTEYNCFTDAVPVNPGRKYAGIMNYCNGKDYNADWKLQSISWYAPDSTTLDSNWSYQNTMNFKKETFSKLGIYLNTWSDEYNCQAFIDAYMDKQPGFYEYIYQYGWKHNYPEYNTKDKISGWWKSPYKTRKSMWWVYEKTFTDTYVATGIEQQQVSAPVKNVDFRVIQDDSMLTYNKESKWLNGTTGKLLIDFSGPSIAFADIYAVQKVSSEEEMVTKIISGEAINGGTVNTIEINFSDYPQLYKSKDIAYYIDIFTTSGGYPNYEYKTEDKTFVALMAKGTHYYNDEPPWVSNIKIKRINNLSELPSILPMKYNNIGTSKIESHIAKKELYLITWDSPRDPDGDPVHYSFVSDKGDFDSINLSTADDYNLITGRQNTWSVRSKEDTVLLNIENKIIGMTSSNSALYVLPLSRLAKDTKGSFIDPLDMWIVPHDGHTSNYYYGTKINLLDVGYDPITLNVSDEKIINDETYIELINNNLTDKKFNVKIYAFMSTHPNDDSSGSYLGVYKRETIDIGMTRINVSVFDEINGEKKFKRGHYIKYAIVCEDIDQNFDPYAEDAWELAVGSHKFNRLPSPVTPFLAESADKVYDDSILKIGWNESIDEDRDSTVIYQLYIAYVNKPDMNTQSEGFWFNGEEDSCYEVRKYYKTFNLGSELHAMHNPYILRTPEFKDGDIIRIWMVARDTGYSSRYLAGDTLSIGDTVTQMTPPKINVFEAKAFNLLGKEQVDGESGFVKVYQHNPFGKEATVYLHAICKKIDGPNAGDMKLFENVATWNLMCGEWSPDTKIVFDSAFGKEWCNSKVRYYAVSTTTDGSSSYDGDMMTVDAYNKWTGEHTYNEQPTPPVIRSGDRTDLHGNIHVVWDYQINEDFRSLENVVLVEGVHDPSTPKVFN